MQKSRMQATQAVCHAHSLGTTWTYLEQRERIDRLLSETLKTEEPIGPEELYRYYRKVCQFLDTEEGRSTVSCHVTMDQLDMRLCMLPAEETFAWGRGGDRKPPEDIPDMFYDFCSERGEHGACACRWCQWKQMASYMVCTRCTIGDLQ